MEDIGKRSIDPHRMQATEEIKGKRGFEKDGRMTDVYNELTELFYPGSEIFEIRYWEKKIFNNFSIQVR